MRIHLSGKKYIDGDEMSVAVYEITNKKNSKGEMTEYKKRLSGYHKDFEHLFDSYFRKTVFGSDLDGELEDMAKLVKKTRNEIRGWWKKVEEVTND